MVLDLLFFCLCDSREMLGVISATFYIFAILSKQQTFYQKTESKILVKH